MLRKMLSYGVLAGLIVAVPLSAMALTMRDGQPPAYAMAIGYLTMLIAFSLVFVAIKRHRDQDLGGVIRFAPALMLGLGISVVAGTIYVLSWECAMAASGIDFADGYAKMLIEQEKAKGTSGAALARFVAEQEAFKRRYADPLFRLPMTFIEIFPVGMLVSLVSAGLLCNSRFLPARRA